MSCISERLTLSLQADKDLIEAANEINTMKATLQEVGENIGTTIASDLPQLKICVATWALFYLCQESVEGNLIALTYHVIIH